VDDQQGDGECDGEPGDRVCDAKAGSHPDQADERPRGCDGVQPGVARATISGAGLISRQSPREETRIALIARRRFASSQPELERTSRSPSSLCVMAVSSKRRGPAAGPASTSGSDDPEGGDPLNVTSSVSGLRSLVAPPIELVPEFIRRAGVTSSRCYLDRMKRLVVAIAVGYVLLALVGGRRRRLASTRASATKTAGVRSPG
jgi:hypothetical protein